MDPPELPDPAAWSTPLTNADQAEHPGWRAPTGPSGGWRRRILPWVVVLVLAGVTRIPGLLTDHGALFGHGGPPGDTVLARYEATEGVLGAPTFQRDEDPEARDTDGHAALWEEWTGLVPAYWVRRVAVFEVASDGTAPGSFAAYVRPLDDAGDRWLLAVDPADAAAHPEYYHETLVHELAHILTIGGGAEDTGPGPFGSLQEAMAACDGRASRHGCFVEGSLLGDFTARFWTPPDVAAADAIHAAEAAGDVDAALDRFRERQADFVTPYAMTDPAEDIAETVVALAFDHAPSPGGRAAAKLEFLRQDPELFALADRIRARLRSG